MKEFLIAVILFLFIYGTGEAQTETYWSTGGEMIFSFANIDNNGDESGNIMRWSPVFNFQGIYNIDFSDNIGIFTGLAIRNVGFIYDNYTFEEDGSTIEVKKKFRTYNLGVPVGIKLGKLKKLFIYGGYDFELPFNYKEKTFRDEKKDKFNVWFSDRVEQFQHGFMVGLQLPFGGNLKFKYYLSNFHNKGYTESDGTKPYENLDANILYFSLNYNLFTPVKSYYKKGSKNEYY
ncbi:MAG: outer membrane beta-barrel protein [Bacteroidales bacterium]|nr:outer membrane beta-barrel protein [Bacteroidales bacterium]